MAYQCDGCGYRTGKWMGFCPQCRQSAGLAERAPARLTTAAAAAPRPLTEVASERLDRIPTRYEEVDRVLGGGLVPGAALLVGGEPGVGKSTLLAQVASSLAATGRTALLISAEESESQVARRARRLGTVHEGVFLMAERDIDAALAEAAVLGPDLVVVDSVQTVATADVGGAAGGVAQVRECAARLTRFAKERGVAVVMVGHVTKDGAIAGPRVVEHLVDVVLYLEGESDQGLRVLRGLKNRFGPTHVAGLFEMRAAGLIPVADPSRALIGDWAGTVAGTVAFPTVEGRRPVLVEVQALVAPASGAPRRSVRGLDAARVHQLLAVLERHAGLGFAGVDVYVAVVGGVRVREPAGDLPVALAAASSLLRAPLGATAAWGEVGLTGELRPASHTARRTEEAARLGLGRLIEPSSVGRIEAALAHAGLVAA